MWRPLSVHMDAIAPIGSPKRKTRRMMHRVFCRLLTGGSVFAALFSAFGWCLFCTLFAFGCTFFFVLFVAASEARRR